MDVILRRFSGLKILRKIPCICHHGNAKEESCGRFFIIEDLIRRLRADIIYIKCPNTLQDIHIPTILYGIHSLTLNQIIQELEKFYCRGGCFSGNNKVRHEQMVELLNRNFSRSYNSISEKRYRCPNIFLLSPKNRDGWNSQKKVQEKKIIQLCCQLPQKWHPVEWEQVVDKPKNWWIQLYPLLIRLQKLIKFVGSISYNTTPKEINTPIYSDIRKKVIFMNEFIKLLSKSWIPENKDAIIEGINKTESMAVLNAQIILYHLLDELDPQHRWGGLSYITTHEGDDIWLCPIHQHQYSYI